MFQAFMIVFREGFEAFLAVAMILTVLRQSGRTGLVSAVASAVGAAIALSVAIGYTLRNVGLSPVADGVVGLATIVLVLGFAAQVWRTAPKMRRTTERSIAAATERRSIWRSWAGVFLFTAFMVSREGVETALLLIQVRDARFLQGALIGLGVAALLSWQWVRYGKHVDVGRFFQVTTLFLVLFAVQIGIYSFHEFSEAGLFRNSENLHAVTEPFSPVGTYGRWFTVGVVSVCAAWLAAGSLLDRYRMRSQVLRRHP